MARCAPADTVGGPRCRPFELLPDEACADEVRERLAGLRLSKRVSVYSRVA